MLKIVPTLVFFLKLFYYLINIDKKKLKFIKSSTIKIRI